MVATEMHSKFHTLFLCLRCVIQTVVVLETEFLLYSSLVKISNEKLRYFPDIIYTFISPRRKYDRKYKVQHKIQEQNANYRLLDRGEK